MRRWFALPPLVLVALAAGARLLWVAGPPAAEPPVAVLPEPEALPPEAVPEAAPDPSPPEPAPLTGAELKGLAGFDDEIILSYVRSTGREFRGSTRDLAELRQAGYSDVLIGRLMGAPAPAPPPAPAEPAAAAAPPPVVVQPATTVYVPVEVTVVAPPPAPIPVEAAPIETVVVGGCAFHSRPGCCGPVFLPPPPRVERTFFKTHAFLPTKRLPTAEEVARRPSARDRIRW